MKGMAICGSCARQTRAKEASSRVSRLIGERQFAGHRHQQHRIFLEEQQPFARQRRPPRQDLGKRRASNGKTLALLPRRQASAPGSPSRSAAASWAS